MYYLIKNTTVIWDLGVLGDIYASELKYRFFFCFVFMTFKTNKKFPAAQMSSYVEKYC